MMDGYKRQRFALHVGGWVYIPKEARRFEIIPLLQGGTNLTWVVPIDVDYVPYLAAAPAFTQADLDAAVRAEREACAGMIKAYGRIVGAAFGKQAQTIVAAINGAADLILERKP